MYQVEQLRLFAFALCLMTDCSYTALQNVLPILNVLETISTGYT